MKYPEIYVQANVCFLYIWKQTTIFEEDCSHLLGKEDSQTEGSQYQKCPPPRESLPNTVTTAKSL